MIYINCLDVSEISKEVYEKFYVIASFERKQKADRYRFFEDAKRCILADILLRFSLFQVWGCKSEPVIERNQYGKPFIKNAADFSYNTSHSGKWVVVAYTDRTVDGEVGIDVEEIHGNAGWDKIANRFFSDVERDYIFSGADETERAGRFTQIWTLKESYVKYLGSGLSKSLESFSIDGAIGRVQDASGRVTDDIILQSYLLDDYYLSVCSRCKDIVMRTVTADQLLAALSGTAS